MQRGGPGQPGSRYRSQGQACQPPCCSAGQQQQQRRPCSNAGACWSRPAQRLAPTWTPRGRPGRSCAPRVTCAPPGWPPPGRVWCWRACGRAQHPHHAQRSSASAQQQRRQSGGHCSADAATWLQGSKPAWPPALHRPRGAPLHVGEGVHVLPAEGALHARVRLQARARSAPRMRRAVAGGTQALAGAASRRAGWRSP